MSAAPALSDGALTGRARGGRQSGPMSLGMIAGLVAVGVFAFGALVMLLSYSDELRADEPTFASALDTSAVGYVGLAQLLGSLPIESRTDPYVAPAEWDGRTLRVYFPGGGLTDERKERIATDHPGIVVLPKWSVLPEAPEARTVVRRREPGLSSAGAFALRSLAPDLAVYASTQTRGYVDFGGPEARIRHIRWIAPRPESEKSEESDETEAGTDADSEDETDSQELDEQTEELLEMFGVSVGEKLMSDETRPTADSVLYRIPDTRLLVLAEPDLFSNHGLETEDRARVALDVLDTAASRLGISDPIIVLDDNLRRQDVDQNLVKLLTRPPFLAATLCLLMAGVLIGWQGFNRFGAPLGEGAATEIDSIASGPAVLATSAGSFIEAAGRIDEVSDRYADVVRRQVVEALGLSVWDARRVDNALSDREALREITPRFADIAADTAQDPMIRAGRLRRWKEDIL